MTLAIGLDVGGTKCAVGVVDVDGGRTLQRLDLPTVGDRSALLQQLGTEAHRLASTYDVVGVGVGLCELVGRDGSVGSAETVAWSADDLRSTLQSAGPVTIESDVRAAARAEARFTDAAEASSFFFVSLGTGISSTLVIDGLPHLGHHGHAIALGGFRLERVASGAALQRDLSQRTGRPITTGEELAAALLEHPDVAGAAATAVAHDLAVAVNVLDPELVVFAGGLGGNAEFRSLIEEAVRPDLYSPATRHVRFRATALGRDAGLIGAALAVVEPSSP